MLEKAKIATKVILVRIQKEKENSRESFYLLRKCINYYEQNIGRRWVKAILVKSQMELINNHWMRRKGGKCYTIV